MNNKTKCILIETDGYSINTSFYDDYNAAFKAMSDRFDEMCPKELDEDCEESTSLNAYDAILYANGENVYVWRIIEIPKLSETEVFNLYHARDREYRKEDARRHLLTDFLDFDEVEEVNEESREDFKETYGVDFFDIYNDEEIIEEMADDFAEEQDCNRPENDTWFLVIQNYLTNLKENSNNEGGVTDDK